MMTLKRTKILDYLCVVLSVIVLVLESLPNSVVHSIRVSDGYIRKSSSFFESPFLGYSIDTFVVAILTIFAIVAGIVLIIKESENVRVLNIIINILEFSIIIEMFTTYESVTGYQIVIAILFFIPMLIGFSLINISNKLKNRKITTLNYLNVVVVGLSLVFELIPTSLRIVAKYNYPHYILSNLYYSYFDYSTNWMLLFGCIIGFLTFFMLLFTLITLSRDNKAFCIVQLVVSSICEVCNIILLIMAGSSVTPYNIIIAILLIVPIITQSIKLKTAYKTKNLVG